MKRSYAVAALAVGAGLAVSVALTLALTLAEHEASASPPRTAPAAAPPDAPVVQTVGTLLDGFKWGVNHADIIKIYNATDTGRFDQEYNPLLARVQPGVRMQALESEREARKDGFAASFIEFKDTPTGYDAGGIKGEYTYRNHESIMSVDKDGKRRYLFFFGSPPGERFWKFYDEVPLKDGGPYGKTFADAVTKLNVAMGAAGRIRAADPAQGLVFTTVDWQDGSTHVRALDRSSEHIVGIVVEEKQTFNSLASLRANVATDPLAMDPSIAAITRGNLSDPSQNQAHPDAGAPRRH